MGTADDLWQRVSWWVGPSALSAATIQDDMAVISGAIGYRADDHGDTAGQATALSGSALPLHGSGVIETIDDLDFFSFSLASQSQLTLLLLPARRGAMLDATLHLYKMVSGTPQLVASSDTAEQAEVLDNLTLESADYRVRVSGSGALGSVGQYELYAANLTGTSGSDAITATASGDTLTVSINSNARLAMPLRRADRPRWGLIPLLGLAGNDTITIDAAVTTPFRLDGGDGNDSLTGGAGDDVLVGGAGADTLSGGSGIDTVDYSSATANLSVTLDGADNDGATGEGDLVNSNIETIIGGAGDDQITATDNVYRTLTGNGGNDVLTAGNWPTTLNGGDGNDTLTGGGSDDVLRGGAGTDSLTGGNGYDLIDGGAGTDTLIPGAGTDTVSYISAGSGVTITLDGLANDGENGDSENVDAEIIVGSLHGDHLTGNGSANTIWGAAGADTILGEAGDDRLYGYVPRTPASSGPADEDLPYGADAADSLSGGDGADSLYGWEGSDTVTGDGGNDSLEGNAAADSLDGGTGADVLVGATGNDTLIGGADNDILTAGPGNDSLSAGAGDDVLDGMQSSSAVLEGGDGNDELYDSGGNDQVAPGTGTNSIFVSSGSDAYTPSSGTDSIEATSAGGLTISGGTFGSGSSLRIYDGTVTFNGDAGSSSALNLSVIVNGSPGLFPIVVFNSTQHLAALTIDLGTVTLSQNGSRVLVTKSLSITKSGSTYLGKLDLKDNDLIIKPASMTAGSTAYTQLFNMIKAGRNQGAWSGSSGVTTSSAGTYTGLALIRNTDEPSDPNSSAVMSTFAGESVLNRDILVKFTWNGDSNLDGQIALDDFFRYDQGRALALSGYRNGDFDYDGSIDDDDEELLDEASLNDNTVL
jgi:Ca2+-binding RTX toxin-like protein